MSKINFLAIILTATLLSACGFHTPHKNNTFNAALTAAAHNPFANALKQHLNPNLAQSMHLKISDEVFKQQNASYKSNNEINSYNLSLSVSIQVFDRNKKILLNDTLTAKSHLNRITATQADKLQINQNRKQLRETLIKRLLRKLNRL